jgi:N-acetylglucosamine-6-phosphate deacetylase
LIGPREELLVRGRVVTPEAVLSDGVVAVRGDRIAWVGSAADRASAGRLPAPSRLTVLPGLVDIHCHGGGGHGFSDHDAEGARAAVRHHRDHGTTSLVASLVSAPADDLRRQVDLLAGLVEDGELAGIHLEGPFLSPQHCGAQDPQAIVPGDPALLRELLRLGRGTVRSMTVAPETAHSGELAAILRDHGAVPSIGHTGAHPALLAPWVRTAGTPVGVTHLFNGMPSWHHRAPGPVPALMAAAARGDAVVELIADGAHLDDETVAAVFALTGPRATALVTDAMAAAGMADGRYRLGGADVEVSGAVARLAAAAEGPTPLAGGTTRLVEVLRRVVQKCGVDLADAVAAASSTPATLLGLGQEVGFLRAGTRADIVVLDESFTVVAVCTSGSWSVVADEQRGSVAWKS